MAESNFTTPEQKNAADRSSGSASEKLEPSLNTLQGETAQMQAEPTIPVREEASAAPKGFGAVLRAAREAEGISVGDMAVQCRLAVTQIRALEEERLENLPEPVYVRAFIRGYAHALKIDPAPLVDDYMMRCGRRGAAVEEIVKLTRITPYFIEQMKELADFDFSLDGQDWDSLSAETLRQAKEMGFSDKYLAQIFGVPEKAVRARRQKDGITATFRIVPVSGVEHAEYYYSTYSGAADEVPVNDKKIMILGGGPNRIGQGIEFDYTCVHAAFTLRDHGYESIMVNCNPETVSTDFDTANKLYFEPVTVEDVLAIYEKEKPEGVIVQFGGQTPLNIAQALKDAGVKIMGTQPEGIRLAEDREYFRERMIALNIRQPESGTARSLEEAVELGRRIGYPVMVRPSFVLGGRGMEVIYDEENLKRYGVEAIQVSPEYPMLIDRFLDNAIEAEVDALADGYFCSHGHGTH